MERQTARIICITLLIGLGLGVLGVAAQASQEVPAPLRLLLVDGTKTFASTARVGALAGAVRSTGAFDFEVRFTDAIGPHDDPLACEADLPETPYDVIVLIPRGLDDGSAESIRVVTGTLPWTSPGQWQALAAITEMIDQVFAGLARAVDPSEDLWPASAASLYQTQGWLR